MTNNRNWLDPLNRIKIQNAVKNRMPLVQLRDGRWFSLNYKAEDGRVLIKPTERHNLVPMGLFDIKKVSDPLWLEKVGD